MREGKEKIGAVIVAAGEGKRMGEKIPKQFLKIKGRPMVFHSVWAFVSHPGIQEVILVTGKDYMKACREIFPVTEKLKIVAGGKERPDSVRAGLSALGSDMDFVLVHDGARPYVSRKIIGQIIEETLETGAAIPGVRPKDTVRNGKGTLDRSDLFSVQTPQGFSVNMLKSAYEEAEEKGFFGTDDASYVEQMGKKVSVIEGEYENIKITTKEDLPSEGQQEVRVGIGYDVHRLAPDRELVLGGVKIPHVVGLLGHSDADVLVHAVMDGLLGAAGLGDIGELFPDTDPAYRGISSLKLLKVVGVKIGEQGFVVGNIDGTVLAERPKLAPYKEKMRDNIAGILGIPCEAINIKATTTEKLGFVGREEGIAAQAVCTLVR